MSPERATELGVEKVDFDTLLHRADFITLHTPLTDATREILNAGAFAKMKKGVRIINCARGELIVEKDLEGGRRLRARWRVSPSTCSPRSRPRPTSCSARELLVATPHLGASTTEAQEKVAVQVAEQMSDFLNTGAVSNAVNMPSLSAEEAARLKPYMKLAEQLGSLHGPDGRYQHRADHRRI